MSAARLIGLRGRGTPLPPRRSMPRPAPGIRRRSLAASARPLHGFPPGENRLRDVATVRHPGSRPRRNGNAQSQGSLRQPRGSAGTRADVAAKQGRILPIATGTPLRAPILFRARKIRKTGAFQIPEQGNEACSAPESVRNSKRRVPACRGRTGDNASFPHVLPIFACPIFRADAGWGLTASPKVHTRDDILSFRRHSP